MKEKKRKSFFLCVVRVSLLDDWLWLSAHTYCTVLHLSLSMSPCMSLSLSFPEGCQIAYANWWHSDLCACASMCVSLVCGCYNLYANLKWVLRLEWWWPDLSSTCQLQLPERDRDKGREWGRGLRPPPQKKAVDVFVKLKVWLLKLFCKIKTLTHIRVDILFCLV